MPADKGLRPDHQQSAPPVTEPRPHHQLSRAASVSGRGRIIDFRKSTRSETKADRSDETAGRARMGSEILREKTANRGRTALCRASQHPAVTPLHLQLVVGLIFLRTTADELGIQLLPYPYTGQWAVGSRSRRLSPGLATGRSSVSGLCRCGARLLEQLARAGNQIADFKWLYEILNLVLFEKTSDFGLRQA